VPSTTPSLENGHFIFHFTMETKIPLFWWISCTALLPCFHHDWNNVNWVFKISTSHYISVLLSSSSELHSFITTAPVGVSSQLHAVCWRYVPLYALGRQFDGCQSWSGNGGKEKSSCRELKAVIVSHHLASLITGWFVIKSCFIV